ncbi:Nitrate reductase [Forsythia ovata]|uniref:Nitrate reductase n=1 Tax=Forsythia ovata TaxID=205694 RepID=A0ABD1USN5_9LAMI
MAQDWLSPFYRRVSDEAIQNKSREFEEIVALKATDEHNLVPFAQKHADRNVRRLRDAAAARSQPRNSMTPNGTPTKRVFSSNTSYDEYWIPTNLVLPEVTTLDSDSRGNCSKDLAVIVSSSVIVRVGEGTADNWVERNPAMVRLTEKHPFNAEALLTRLMHHGFITHVPLYYVRNHGYVPKARWDEWSVEITGLVKHPMKLTMHQLVDEFSSDSSLRRKSQKRAKHGETDHRFQLGCGRNIHLRLARGAIARHSEAVRYL